MGILVFDIETIPDIKAGRQLYNLSDQNDHDVAQTLYYLRKQQTGGQSDFLRHHLHQIVAISVVWAHQDELKVMSLGSSDSNEKTLIKQFFNAIERHTPTLVSWNGRGFDLPVLHYRALLHALSAPRYWDTGEDDNNFRWNNYISRYHNRHLDLMDVLAAYQPRVSAPLDEIATLLGFPGKMGMSGASVWDYYQQGKIDAIRNYCETDVLNTYLIFLRFDLMRGKLTQHTYQQQCEALQRYLKAAKKAHFDEFLKFWQQALTINHHDQKSGQAPAAAQDLAADDAAL